MPHGRHNTVQTAFRLPEGLLAWLRGQAAAESPATMTDIVVRALEAERERCEDITTRVTTTPSVSPPRRARKPREAPAAVFVAAEQPRPVTASHRPNCKCAVCKPPGATVRTGGKPVVNWLIVYKRSDGKLLRCDEFADGRAALAERFQAEREHAGDPDLEIVVLGADSLEALKVTHGRYFLSAPELAARAAGTPGEQK